MVVNLSFTFASLGRTFDVQMGHQDIVDQLPDGAVCLASSDRVTNQALRFPGKPIYGTQFHTELLPERLIERLTLFRQYMPDDQQFEDLKANMRPTPYAAQIMQRFLEVVVLR